MNKTFTDSISNADTTPLDNGYAVDDNSTREIIDEFTWPQVLVTLSSGLFLLLCDVIAHITVLIITVVISRRCLNLKLQRTGEHAFYCTLAFVSFTSESLIISHCWWMLDLIGKRNCDLVHIALGLMALCIGLLGISVEIYRRRFKSLKHLQTKVNPPVVHLTTHGALGFGGCILSAVCLATGVALLFFSNLPLHLTHRFCGLLGFVVLMFCQWHAYNTEYIRRHWRFQTIRLLKWTTLVATITSSIFEFKAITRDIVFLLPKEIFETIAVHDAPTHANQD
ncbi:uncharacterized protein Dwil_GK25528 [Drosophila willistoni]|uniref:Cytochrome b561 domain-containing protein n=1 Tax=Drosophila willistoni TaxID=7260 RepID=B4NDX0_DROWI|nr:uncharacterized protein LOC6648863 [Drosophila willistoni]EDW81939.1 uncharacterized protein Dwil_GK25528 [Drosophila willistoni]